ncbi:MAG TPA: ATP-binding protein [Tepidisphaeraceae bacterium]|jgi:signal transduction histidine kinase/HAMP domain-containing protein
MSFGIGQKIALGFGGLLIILLAIGTLSVVRLNTYSRTLERIFRENYDSISYTQGMRDTLRRLENLATDVTDPGRPVEDTQRDAPALLARFDADLRREADNVTLAGEQAMVDELAVAWHDYRDAHTRLRASTDPTVRHDLLRDRLRPAGNRIEDLAAGIAELNLQNIVSVDGQVRQTAVRAKQTLYALVGVGVLLAVVFTLVISRSILGPLRSLTKSAREIEQGNLDLVVKVRGRDEVGQLAEAFNAMATKLREFRRSDRAKIIRTQQTTQLSVDSLPDAVALVSVGGHVELANQTARRLFALAPGVALNGAHAPKIVELYRQARDSGRPVGPGGYDSVIQVFETGGGERFFLPRAIPIVDGGEAIGVTIVLADVTNLRKIDEMKSGLLSVVSHELKTPLTSIRMATHLLLEERVGPLTPKQAELMVAARDDAERLHGIVENLLDMARLESGRAQLDLTPRPIEPLLDAMTQPHQAAFHDKGVTLAVDVSAADGLSVLIDADRIEHVFTNLLLNAVRFTPAGGRVDVSAEPDPADARLVRFSVTDTGIGIGAEHLPHVFERFFRVPGQTGSSGAGLGLAIAKDIVEAHGGTIGVESEPGQGTRLTFTLVAAPGQDLPQDAST